MYSYKLKKNGIRTQFVSDMNDMIIYTSKINENDCIAFDSGYYYYIKKFVETCD
ncbi:hypothetical protein BDB00DRAFT_748534, partial [Zychaea mexicana]|uniref:uncharacterized protein n=1 Tax=Zychaea mexicana TaxID=64656 RepID=UPI0022FEF0D4